MGAFRVGNTTERTGGLCGFLAALVVLAGLPATIQAAAGLPEPRIPDSIGIVVHGFPGAPGELEQFVQTGVRVVRSDLLWWSVEKERGKYDFSYYDRCVDGYAQHGIRMLLILDYGNTLYTEGQYDLPQTDEARAAFARFAAAAAERYRNKGVMFELWNEPDGSWSAEDYMAWAKAVVPVMRQANPDVVIMGPAAHQWALRWLEDCFQLGLLELVDAVSIHLYIGGYGGSDQPQEIPEVNAPGNYYLGSIRELIAKYAGGDDIPLVSSEWGYNRWFRGQAEGGGAVSTEDQAMFLARSYLLSVLWGLRFNTWYCWWLNTASIVKTSNNYGLITAAGMPLPSYYALKNLTTQLDGGRLRRRIDVGSKGDYVLEFTTPTGPRWAVWTAAVSRAYSQDAKPAGSHTPEWMTGKPHSVSIPVGAYDKVLVTDLLGSRNYELPVESGEVTIRVTGAVQYLRVVD